MAIQTSYVPASIHSSGGVWPNVGGAQPTPQQPQQQPQQAAPAAPAAPSVQYQQSYSTPVLDQPTPTPQPAQTSLPPTDSSQPPANQPVPQNPVAPDGGGFGGYMHPPFGGQPGQPDGPQYPMQPMPMPQAPGAMQMPMLHQMLGQNYNPGQYMGAYQNWQNQMAQMRQQMAQRYGYR